MDVLSQLLSAASIAGSVFCFGEVRSPWRFTGGARGRALFHVVTEGSATLRGANGVERRLVAGDVALLPSGGIHTMGSGRARRRSTPLGDAIDRATPFARFTIGGQGARSYLICGSFSVEELDWHPLWRALPELLVVNAADIGPWLQPTLDTLARYLEEEGPGAGLIGNRLAEILLVQTLAGWIASEAIEVGWLAAARDPRIGRCLGAIHGSPARDWTIDALGREAGMSRTAMCARFKALVGEPPGAYLSRWRITLASRALRTSTSSIAEISRGVGYASVPSFTKAFRRYLGTTPGAYRREQR